MSATQALAAEQLPEEHTMSAIEGATPAGAPPPSPPPLRSARPPTPLGAGTGSRPQPLGCAAEEEALVVRRVRVADVRSSRSSPGGRPSAAP
jgi:hypothetical protein